MTNEEAAVPMRRTARDDDRVAWTRTTSQRVELNVVGRGSEELDAASEITRMRLLEMDHMGQHPNPAMYSLPHHTRDHRRIRSKVEMVNTRHAVEHMRLRDRMVVTTSDFRQKMGRVVHLFHRSCRTSSLLDRYARLTRITTALVQPTR